VRSCLAALAAVLLAGCGSTDPAKLPPPAGPVHSPPTTVTPAGRYLSDSGAILTFAHDGALRVDGAHDRLIAGDHSARTCREPVDRTFSDSKRLIAVLCGRERVVELFDARTLKPVGTAPAGTGPARIASDGRADLYVTDVVGESLLVYHLHPRFELIRRVHLPGGPFAIAHDPARSALWITLTARNQVVEYADGSRPVPIRAYPTERQPNDVDVTDAAVLINHDEWFEPPRDRARPTR
jgi:hypothetical protein